MGVIEELNEILGEDVVTRAFAQALEAQGTSPRMGVDEIEQRLERGEDVYIDADWCLTERNLIDLVPQIVATPFANNGLAYAEPKELANLCLNHLAGELEIFFEMSDVDILNEVTRSFSEYARNTCEGMPCQEEVDTLLDAPGLASELREWGGCWQDMHVEELARSAEFRASTLLAATNGCEPESAVLDSILQWQEDSYEWEDGRLAKAEDALPYSRPSDIGPSAIDWLCESQGTTLEGVVNDPKGAFAESMREELLESGCCGSRPCVCVMSSMSFGQWVTTTSCTAAAPEMEGCAFVADDSCLVGIYDPTVGAGSLMGVRLERPMEVPAPLVRDNMQEPEYGETWGSYYTPQGCYGFCEPFAGHAKDAPKGREARLPSPHESQDIHRP